MKFNEFYSEKIKAHDFIFENLDAEEILMVEFLSSVASWAGRQAAKVSNVPGNFKAGYYGVTAKPGTPEYDVQIQGKQFGLNPDQYKDPAGNFDQKAWNKALAMKQMAKMSPQERMEFQKNQQYEKINQARGNADYQKLKTQAYNYKQQATPGGALKNAIDTMMKTNTNLTPQQKGAMTNFKKAFGIA